MVVASTMLIFSITYQLVGKALVGKD